MIFSYATLKGKKKWETLLDKGKKGREGSKVMPKGGGEEEACSVYRKERIGLYIDWKGKGGGGGRSFAVLRKENKKGGISLPVLRSNCGSEGRGKKKAIVTSHFLLEADEGRRGYSIHFFKEEEEKEYRGGSHKGGGLVEKL